MDREEVMSATFEVLAEHSYAELSISRIAEELGTGKSTIYYHFEDKQDLMQSFLDVLSERLEEEMLEPENSDPEKRLEKFLDRTLEPCSDEMWDFRKALFEMRSQAPYNQEFSDRFERIDGLMLSYLEDIFHDLGFEKPEQDAELVLSTVEGAITRGMILQDRSKTKKLHEFLLRKYL